MNVVDSSGWMEYARGDGNAFAFAQILEQAERLLVPTIVVFEVRRKLLQLKVEDSLVQAIHEAMNAGTLIDLSHDLAVAAAELSVLHSLSLADSIIYTTAQSHEAMLWTQDIDFQGLPDVTYFPKPNPAP